MKKEGVIFIVAIIIIISTVFYHYGKTYLSPAGIQSTTLKTSSYSSGTESSFSGIEENIPTFASDRIIVKFSPEVSSKLWKSRYKRTGMTDIDDVINRLGATVEPAFKVLHKEEKLITTEELAQTISTKYPQRQVRNPSNQQIPQLENIYLVKVEPGTDILDAVSSFKSSPNVIWAQPDYLATTYSIPNDPFYSSSSSWGQPYDDLWGLKPNKIDAEHAWDVTQGQSIVVAVVDTGVDYDHPDISLNIWVNPGEDLNGNGQVDPTDFDGIDNNNNGYVDDIRGWDFYYSDNNPLDGYGHGTHVAGTIAAVGDNGIGIIGVAPQAQVMIVKGLSDSGSGTVSTLGSSILYAIENGADIVSNSWGCSTRCPSNPVIEDVVRTAHALGAVIVFAAGNVQDDVFYISPQNMVDPKPIVVAASTEMDVPAYFTNFGLLVDLSAPGGGTDTPPPTYQPFRNILSLKSAFCSFSMCSQLTVAGNYLRQAGTSMAAPHAAGAAALILANNPTWTNDEVRQVLRVSADDIGEPGFDPYTGAGRMNVMRALQVDSVLNVSITNPSSSELFHQFMGSIPIIGTASGPDFQSYQLFFQEATNINNVWTAIDSSSTIPVVNSLLGNWIVEDLPTGFYALKVVTTTSSGSSFEAITLVFLERYIIQPITTRPQNEVLPSIHDNKIVWESQGSNTDIYLYDLTTQTEQRITTDSTEQISPDIWGDKIVYISKISGRTDIYLYDLTTQTEQRITTSDSQFQFNPKIFGDKIVWGDSRNNNFDVYLYDLTTQTEQRITTDSTEQISPDIWGDKIVWSDNRNGRTDIYLYDLTTQTEQRITTDPSRPTYSVSIWDNKIVWSDTRNNVNGDYDIYLYDLTTQTEQRITTDPTGEHVSTGRPDIWGDKIVWSDNRNDNDVLFVENMDIYLYDLTTQTEQRITTNVGAQKWPAIWNGRIVWEDYRTTTSDIYFAYLNEPPVLAPIGNKVIRTTQLLTFNATASDPNGDSLTLSATPLPSGASFTNNGNNTGTFSWQPKLVQAGTYNITFTVSDEELTDSETITIKVVTLSNIFCGNGIIESAEQCEFTNLGYACPIEGPCPQEYDLNGQTCQSLGYNYGTLACTSSCQFDTSECG